MEANKFAHLLFGRDLRTLKQNSIVVKSVNDQKTFDVLFQLIFHSERSLVMRAADAIEKITVKHPEYLGPHKSQLLRVLKSAEHKELKWHIAQLIPRVDLNRKELEDAWNVLTHWTKNKNESRIVRVNSLQGLFDMAERHPEFRIEFDKTAASIERESVPSILARLRRIRKIQARMCWETIS